MQVGDLVKVHWGHCDRSGKEGTDWGHAQGIVLGEIRWWGEDVRGKVPCGDVNVLVQGQETSYNIGRCKVVA
jgi:hypothetical protein